MSHSTVDFDPIATIMAARQRQIQSLMNRRQSQAQIAQGPAFAYSNGQSSGQSSYSNGFTGDSVTIGGQSWGWAPQNDNTLSNGQSIEDLFENPYADDPEMAAIMQDVAKLAQARRANNSNTNREAQKGELRVIAGSRADGVKPKEVRIDEHNGYDYAKDENNFHDDRTETRKEGKLGTEYDVTVTWEDGTTTTKRVTLKQSNQIVYMNDSYSY